MKKTQQTRVGDTSLKHMPRSGKAMHGKRIKPASIQSIAPDLRGTSVSKLASKGESPNISSNDKAALSINDAKRAHKSFASSKSSSREVEHQEAPPNIPNLFKFVWKPSGRYEAEMETDLYNLYWELCRNASISDFDLSWTMDIALKVPTTCLEYLVEKHGSIMLPMTDEACEMEFGRSLSIQSKVGQISIMRQCCQIVLAIQRALGSDLTDLMEKDAEGKSRARQRLMKKINALLSLLEGQREHHNGAIVVKVRRVLGNTQLPAKDEYEEEVVLAARVIEVTQELTTKLGKLPTKKEVQDTMVELHDELRTIKVNWSQCFTQAGLTKLPRLLPWGSSKPK